MSSISFWQKTADLPHPKPPAAQPEHLTAEVCIIGGGIVGSSAAYHLAKRSVPAVLLEAREPAMGASGRNAGMIVAGIAGKYCELVGKVGRERARQLWQFSIENREATFALATQLGVPIVRLGHLSLADSEEEAALLRESAELLEADGFEVDYRPSNPLGRGFINGLGDPHSAATNPAKLVQAILQASGQPAISYSPVTQIERHGQGLRVISERAMVDCERVLLATNAYSEQLFPYFDGRVRPCRGQIQVTEPVDMVMDRGGSSQFGYYYFRHIPDPETPGKARWLMGGARNVNFAAENGHFSEETTDEIQAALTAFSANHFPELAGAKIEHRWAGTMGFTRDQIPLVGTLPEWERVTYCVGFSGHGMALALNTAEAAVQLMLDGFSHNPIVQQQAG